MPVNTGTFVATGVSPVFQMDYAGELKVRLKGTFVGTVVVEKGAAGGELSWSPVAGPYTGTTNISLPGQTDDVYRLHCTSYTSGTVQFQVGTPESGFDPANASTMLWGVLASSAGAPAVGGSGYQVGDTITTSVGAVVLLVLAVGGGGAVTSFAVQDAGSINVVPPVSLVQSSTTGVGIGIVVTPTYGPIPAHLSGAPNAGTFVCNGATPVTVANTQVGVNSAIIITLKTVGGTVGAVPAIKTITAGTGFTVAGTASDTSTYNYRIIG